MDKRKRELMREADADKVELAEVEAELANGDGDDEWLLRRREILRGGTPREHMPYPEIVQQNREYKGITWDIEDTRHEGAHVGQTNKTAHQMRVPLDDQGHGVCRHELAHTRWSPMKPPDVPYDPVIVQAVEDARMNMHLEKLGVPYYWDEGMAKLGTMNVRREANAELIPALVLRGIARLGGSGIPPMDSVDAYRDLPGETREFIEGCVELVESTFRTLGAARSERAGPPPFTITRKLADEIARRLQERHEKEAKEATPPPPPPGERAGLPLPPGEGLPPMSGGLPSNALPRGPVVLPRAFTAGLRKIQRIKDATDPMRCVADGAPMSAKKIERTLDRAMTRISMGEATEKLLKARMEALAQSKYDSDEAKGFGTPMQFRASLGSGVMSIEKPRLTLTAKGRKRGKGGRYRARADGSRIGRLDRLYSDGAVFRRKVRRGGGSVLIDVSGSMSLNMDEVDELIHAARGSGIVAIYCGSGAEGVLRIIAKGNRRAPRDCLEVHGGGNIVDFHALRWLGKQAEPRIWISDGGVTGIYDYAHEDITKACAEVRRKFRIVRVADAPAALELMESMNEGVR